MGFFVGLVALVGVLLAFDRLYVYLCRRIPPFVKMYSHFLPQLCGVSVLIVWPLVLFADKHNIGDDVSVALDLIDRDGALLYYYGISMKRMSERGRKRD